MSNATSVTDDTFDAEVSASSIPVVVDFWAEWCGPCKAIGPALDEIAGKLAGKIKVVKVNVDENPDTASKCGVMSVPTLMIFKGGELIARQIGAQPRHKLEQWINQAA
jgi:thioredoxin 1